MQYYTCIANGLMADLQDIYGYLASSLRDCFLEIFPLSLTYIVATFSAKILYKHYFMIKAGVIYIQ